MQIQFICVGSKMPAWVEAGYQEYAKRLPPECRLQLIEIPLEKRTKTMTSEQYKEREGKRILAAIPAQSYVIALEVKGKAWNTIELSKQMQAWMQKGQDVCLLVGGPDGLSEECRARAQAQWSLSNLTLPHPLVRIVVAEQLYRAWSVLQNHPYHRE